MRDRIRKILGIEAQPLDVLCYACKGSGYAGRSECDVCYGTGYQVTRAGLEILNFLRRQRKRINQTFQ